MGRGRVRKRAEAVADLVEHGEYLRDVASRETAARFLAAAERTFAVLRIDAHHGEVLAVSLPRSG
jgi:hypothetical protein